MKKISLFILFFLFMCIGNELGTLVEHKKWLNDKDYLSVVNYILSKNDNNSRIIYSAGSNTPYISKTSMTILTQYSIENYGVIPRWTKMHKVISQWIDSADKADLIKLQK